MLLAIILVLSLIANWLINETLVFTPVNLLTHVVSIGWWGVATAMPRTLPTMPMLR